MFDSLNLSTFFEALISTDDSASLLRSVDDFLDLFPTQTDHILESLKSKFISCISKGSFNCMKIILEKTKVNKFELDLSAIMIVITKADFSRKIDALDNLIKHGCNLNHNVECETTLLNPIHAAVYSKQPELIVYLTIKGAQISQDLVEYAFRENYAPVIHSVIYSMPVELVKANMIIVNRYSNLEAIKWMADRIRFHCSETEVKSLLKEGLKEMVDSIYKNPSFEKASEVLGYGILWYREKGVEMNADSLEQFFKIAKYFDFVIINVS
jgi:hypothetical protein